METPVPMTPQAMFDIVAPHLLRQGRRSTIATYRSGDVPHAPPCAYRGNSGLKCAVGVLIPDEVYHQYDLIPGTRAAETSRYLNELEGVTCSALPSGVLQILGFNVFDNAHAIANRGLASALQAVHDEIEPPKWRRALRDVAVQHNLSFASTVGVTAS